MGTNSSKITISKKKLYIITVSLVILVIAGFLIYYFNVLSTNKLRISELSASGYNLPLTTYWGWHVTIKIQNVGSNDVSGAQIKVELVCDGLYLDTETETIDKLSASWEKTTTISVSADRTTTNVLSANERKVIVTIYLNGAVLDTQTLNL